MEAHFPSDPFAILETLQDEAGGSPRLEAKARARLMVAQALTHGRVSFYYQPVVRSSATAFPAFYEMLARLTLPDGRVLPAGVFLPVVEETALGRAIDRLALVEALKALEADPGLRVSVNMSPLSMGDAEWLSILSEAAARGDSVCGRLILEITEDAALGNAAQTIDFMNHVRSMGCAFALDDFGAGATGFRHFRDFRFDMVKIDGSFITDVHRNRDAQVLVECLVAVARHFEMVCVAERVETELDADWLIGLGVDCMQGYLYGRPSVEAKMPGHTSGGAAAAG